MKIMLFGGMGQLGSILKKKILSHHILITPNQSLINMYDQDIIKDYILDNCPNLIINLSAFTNVDGCESNVKLAYDLNANAPKIISESASMIDSKFIHLSTDYVFNQKGINFLDEETEIKPISIYGKSKALGEKYIINTKTKYIILRTSWVYSDVGKNFFLTIKNLLNLHNQINVVDDQFGAPTLAYDLVDSIICIINFLEEREKNKINLNNIFGIYHVSNAGSASWYEFACKISDKLGYNPSIRIKPVNTKDFGSIAQRPFNSKLDNSKLKKIFKIEMPFWEESFEYFYKNFQLEKD
jgi:dTDP-4-dehydrorhamnose reductase